MFGRATASQMASASAASFLFVFTYGLTNWGAISFDGVPEAFQLARPMVGTAACFHADQARRKIDKERGHLVTFELLLQDGLAAFVDHVDLEHVLCQVDANRRNLHDGRPLSVQVVD